MQSSRSLLVNWKSLDGAAHAKRRLLIRQNAKNLFSCPVKLCLHNDFHSSRGLRKHINTKHPWYFYFDNQPEVKREEMIERTENKRMKAFTSRKPAFSLEEGIGSQFLQWLTTPCGGGKSQKEALQVGKRTMKFFMSALGSNEDNKILSLEFIDCCLSSASILMSFLKVLEENWKLSSSGSLNYVTAIGDMIDFRKAHGVPDDTLRCFVVTEVYLRRAKENLRKKKNIECTRNLGLETLIARNSWATIEEMEEVIPFHLKGFKTIIDKRQGNGIVTKNDLVFCTRFITTLLFLRVKCSRPMTFQYLTTNMIEKAKVNGGFVDQTEFKTASKYLFDTLLITDDVLEILDIYINDIRPCLNPQCDFLLVSTNGTQFQSLTTAMSMMVHQAIGKHINPTRYRQIVETESSERLTLQEQQYISEDQKHSSIVAKINYKKKVSRQVAIEGKKCMDKMTEKSRAPTQDLMQAFKNIDSSFDPSVLATSQRILQDKTSAGCCYGSSTKEINVHLNENDDIQENDPYQPCNLDISTDLTITQSGTKEIPTAPIVSEALISAVTVDNSQKKEVLKLKPRKALKNVKFSYQEDNYLSLGIAKHGRKAWALILKDESYIFHPSRTRDSLRIRADSASFKKNFVNT